MKSIYTLIPDIYELVKRKDGWFSDDISNDLSKEISLRLKTSLSEDHGPPRLRLSRLGNICPCALWHSIHHPELAESLPSPALIKYSYGHVIEALALALAKCAGHEVTGEQDELVLDGVVGHRDAVIDGCVVDVKSATSLGFAKFKDGSIGHNDPFGYLDQLDGYVVASAADDLVRTKDRGYLLVIDKNLGHMCIYEHRVREDSIRKRIECYKQIVGSSTPPACTCGTVEDGKSGNVKLDTRASYSPFKFCCFPRLRTFLYADGPRYLTKVVRKPDVPEVDRYGKIVYN